MHLGSWKLRTGDSVVQLYYAEQSVQLEAENWRLRSTTLVHGVFGELDDENWRLCSTTLVRGAICRAGSGELAEPIVENWTISSYRKLPPPACPGTTCRCQEALPSG